MLSWVVPLDLTSDPCLYLLGKVGKEVALILVISWLKRHVLSSYVMSSVKRDTGYFTMVHLFLR